YMAQDLKEPTFRELLRGESSRLAMVATAPGHLGGTKPAGPAPENAPDSERTTSGNTVVLEDQMMKVAKTVMDFQLATNLYRKHVAMIKTALGRGGGV